MITIQDVTQVILNLSGKSLPLDYVPVSILRGCVDAFTPLIARLANQFFSKGCFPDMFNSGQIRPLLMKPGVSTSYMSNFHPITNLNTTGKILERLAMKQLQRHSDHSPNLGHLQPTYRALHSTETALTKVVSDLLSAVDGGKPSALLSLCISAAFDNLDHHHLLSREHS